MAKIQNIQSPGCPQKPNCVAWIYRSSLGLPLHYKWDFIAEQLTICWNSWTKLISPRTSNEKLFSINEEVQREALKGFYDRYWWKNYRCKPNKLVKTWSFNGSVMKMTKCQEIWGKNRANRTKTSPSDDGGALHQPPCCHHFCCCLLGHWDVQRHVSW